MVNSMYRGRFAPSPTGPLHAGSLVAALASWLDARAHRGCWWVRIEDVDTPRCVPGADQLILAQLAACGLVPDAPPQWQSNRYALYEETLAAFRADMRSLSYDCACTRSDIAQARAQQGQLKARHHELVYPGTCRQGLQGKAARSIRVRTLSPQGDDVHIEWADRRLGPQRQNLTQEVGDFVLRRADGLWAYQWAVVIDDAAQGITHIVRGADLADNTARQIHLQRLLGLLTPIYLHTPLVLGPHGEKLSKQNGAAPLDTRDPLLALRQAGSALGLPAHMGQGSVSVQDWLSSAVSAWQELIKKW